MGDALWSPSYFAGSCGGVSLRLSASTLNSKIHRTKQPPYVSMISSCLYIHRLKSVVLRQRMITGALSARITAPNHTLTLSAKCNIADDFSRVCDPACEGCLISGFLSCHWYSISNPYEKKASTKN